MRMLVPILCLSFGLLLSWGCATPGPQGPVPLYDFDNVWFNDGMGGVRPWKPRDRRAATRAALARESDPGAAGKKRKRARTKRKLAKGASHDKRRATRAGGSAGPKRRGAQARNTKGRAARANPKRSRSERAKKPRKRAPSSLGPKAIAQATPRLSPRKRAAKSDLGDGSVASELVAAARRLVGLHRGPDAEPFLAHLTQVAAVRMKVKAPRALYNAAAWRHLSSSAKTLDGDAPRPGDLVFFHDTHDRNGDGTVDDPFSMVAVVESVRPSGAVICVGDAYNRVIRFSMNATKPTIRRDDASGEVMNTPIRRRTRHDGPETPVLAGQLYAGMARL